jgi:hypothetical protein
MIYSLSFRVYFRGMITDYNREFAYFSLKQNISDNSYEYKELQGNIFKPFDETIYRSNSFQLFFHCIYNPSLFESIACVMVSLIRQSFRLELNRCCC